MKQWTKLGRIIRIWERKNLISMLRNLQQKIIQIGTQIRSPTTHIQFSLSLSMTLPLLSPLMTLPLLSPSPWHSHFYHPPHDTPTSISPMTFPLLSPSPWHTHFYHPPHFYPPPHDTPTSIPLPMTHPLLSPSPWHTHFYPPPMTLPLLSPLYDEVKSLNRPNITWFIQETVQIQRI